MGKHLQRALGGGFPEADLPLLLQVAVQPKGGGVGGDFRRDQGVRVDDDCHLHAHLQVEEVVRDFRRETVQKRKYFQSDNVVSVPKNQNKKIP